MRTAIENSHDGWENLYSQSPGPDDILIVGVRKDENRQHQGRTLRAIAQSMGLHPIDAALELIRRDRSRIDTVYFMMTEENLRKQIQQRWVSFGSDASSMAAEGAFLRDATIPAPTATSRGCSASTCAMKALCRWPRRSAA